MRDEYADYDLPELKTFGHQLLDEYIALDDKRSGTKARRHAYEKLRSKVRDNFHFSKITSRSEALHVIGKIRTMIKNRQKKLEFFNRKAYDVYAPRETVREALARLSTH